MTPIELCITLGFFLAAACWLIWLWAHQASRQAAKLIEELHELRQDNRALTEALVRAEGKPLIFRRSDPIRSSGWFDQAKTTTELAEKIKSK